MRKLFAILLVCIFLTPTFVFSQVLTNGKDLLMTNDVLITDKTKEAAVNQMIYDITTRSKTTLSASLLSPATTSTITLPVVVHIIHDNGAENISDAQVADAIAQLNEGFKNGTNYDPSTGVDMQIEFCLAKQDPFVNHTSGINRIQSPLTNMTMETDDQTLKSLIQWDPTRYINIWVVKSIVSTSAGPSIAEYASTPASHGTPTDGIVIEAGSFGVSYEQTKILIHSLGHYLGLYHTFEGGCKNDNCLLDGDRVADTPPDASTQYVDCSIKVNSCSTDTDDLSTNNPFRPVSLGGLGDQNDLSDNFMDVNYLSCLNSFTQGQKDRVRIVLQNQRSSLLTSPGCNSICPTPIEASYTVPSTEVEVGTIYDLINTSTPATGLTYEWYLNDILFSTDKDSYYSFTRLGTFTITLVIRSSSQACIDMYSKTFHVTCPLRADFSISATFVRPGTKITFVNTSDPGFINCSWLVDNVVVSSNVELNEYTFTQEGSHTVSLIVSNYSCQNRRDIHVEVNACPQIGKRANTWYFGLFGGLSFTAGPPVPLTGPSYTYEGCSSISDENGNYLFSVLPTIVPSNNFTTTVTDRTNATMPNGTGLAGNHSTSQVAIVPQPGNSNLYYVFSMFELGTGGLYYSIVDMSKNGGLGDVIVKNVKLQDFTSEKIAVTAHSNGRDYWVVTHPWNSGDFYTYLINQSGLQPTPVISTAGSLLSGQENGACGVLKISPNGKLVAMSAQYNPGSYVEVFDFNNSTGRLSPVIKLDNFPLAYGVEFSPDASKLYVSSGYYSSDGGLYQYNLSLSNSKDILNSKCFIYKPECYGQMQLAPDGRIYYARAESHWIGAIQNPNDLGLGCNYDPFTIFMLPDTRGYYGFPSFSSNFVAPNPIKIAGPKEACPSATSIVYQLNNTLPASSSVVWSCSGQMSITSQSSTSATVSFKTAGTAQLRATITLPCGTYTDILDINVRNSQVNLGPDLLLCKNGSILLDAGPGFVSYKWQDGSTAQTLRVLQTGSYSVDVVSAGGCTSSDRIEILPALSSTSLNLGPDRTVCPGSVAILDAGAGFQSYRWQDGSTGQTFTAFSPGNTPGVTRTYSVTVTDACGSSATDTINITFNNPAVNAGPDVTICRGLSTVLKGSGTGNFKWKDANGNLIGTSSEITVTPSTSAFYVLTVESNGCSSSDTVYVTVDNNCSNCTIDAGANKTICKGQTATLSATTNGNCTKNRCTHGTSPVSCASGCTISLSGSSNVELFTGQVGCVQTGTVYTGNVTLSGGSLYICGTAKPSNINFNSGRIIVNGDATFSSLSINGHMEIYGNVTINNDCNINSNGELFNYGNLIALSSFSDNNKLFNYSSIVVNNCLNVNSNATFLNECTVNIGSDLQVNSLLNNRGSIFVGNTANLNGGSRYSASDGSLLSTKNIYCNSFIDGGTVGYSSITVSQTTVINGGATISGLLDICDKNGIETKAGSIASTVTTDCRTVPDGTNGVATFVWTDIYGRTVGVGKQISVKPTATTTYTVTVTDVLGNRLSDQVTVLVNICP